MPKTKISDYSSTANLNSDINSINIAEGCAPSNINDAIREMMAQLKNYQAGLSGDTVSAVGSVIVKGTSTTGADIQLYEDTDNGTNYVAFKAPASIATNVTWTLPSADGTSGQAITTDGAGVLSFASVLTASGTATLTNKTIEAGTFTNGYTEEVATANTSTSYTVDLANGSVQILTLTGNCTFTFPTATAGRSFIMILKQDATGSRTVTWPAAVKWPSGTAPTITSTASKSDKYIFTADGTNWIGSNAGQNYTL